MILVNLLRNLTFISHRSPDLISDLSRLINLVNFKKDHDVVCTLPGITVTQVTSILKRVSPNKSAGINKINTRYLRLAAQVIAPSIARMINYSFAT